MNYSIKPSIFLIQNQNSNGEIIPGISNSQLTPILIGIVLIIIGLILITWKKKFKGSIKTKTTTHY